MEFSSDVKNKLIQYQDLILKWNKKINLISKNTEKDIWNRHIIDSAQLFFHISQEDIICDIGSGAGLPGIVLSIMGIKNSILIESDMRKSIFLNQAKNISDNNISILNERVEDFQSDKHPKIDYVVSRALADISKILEFSRIINPSKGIILLKGQNYKKELEEASQNWHFDIVQHKSITNTESVILKLNGLTKN